MATTKPRQRVLLIAAVIVALPGIVHAQATIKQLGPVVSQHLGMYAGNGQLMDAGGITAPGGPPQNSNSPGTRPTGLGIVNPGLGYAQFTGYANANHAEFLWGFTSSGDGLIKLDRVGDDAPLTLYCEINHVRQPCGTLSNISIRPGTGLASDPDPLTTSGEIWLEDTAVQPGLYPYASVTVDQQGRIIDIAAGSIPPDPTPPGDPDGALQYNCAGIFCGASVATGLDFSGGSLALTQVFNDKSSGDYTILTGDGAKTIEVGAHIYTLPEAGTVGFEVHWGTCLLNISGGDAAINTTTSVFSGAGGGTSLTLHPGDWACPSSDGANYPTVAGSGTGSGLGTVTSVNTGTGLTGGPITGSGTIALADTAVTPGSYTYASLTVDQQGRLTAAGNGAAPPSGANPTAMAGPAAVNGTASSFMRSDAAPPVQKASAVQFGIVEVDNTSITASGGVISATGAGLGTVTSVAATAPSGVLSIGGSPITASGTFTFAWAGTSGGLPCFDSATSLASSALLTANRLVLGGGAGACPTVLGSLGTTTTVLHGNAAGPPTFGPVSLTADVSGTLPVGNGGTGITSGTSGGLLYFSGASTIASSGALTANAFLTGGGAGAAPNAVAITGLVLGAGASAPGAYAGASCANQFPRSQNASGGWTCATVANTDLANSTISGIALGSNLAALTATDTTLTLSGSYNGSTARTVGINLGNDNTWTGTETFGTVIGGTNTQSGTTYTLAASDCGKTVRFTSASAITLTTLNSLSVGCSIAVLQAAAGQVTVSSGAGATLVSRSSYTKTAGQWAIIGLFVESNSGGSAAQFVLTGDGA